MIYVQGESWHTHTHTHTDTGCVLMLLIIFSRLIKYKKNDIYIYIHDLQTMLSAEKKREWHRSSEVRESVFEITDLCVKSIRLSQTHTHAAFVCFVNNSHPNTVLPSNYK